MPDRILPQCPGFTFFGFARCWKVDPIEMSKSCVEILGNIEIGLSLERLRSPRVAGGSG
jgi:hypothetical protein